MLKKIKLDVEDIYGEASDNIRRTIEFCFDTDCLVDVSQIDASVEMNDFFETLLSIVGGGIKKNIFLEGMFDYICNNSRQNIYEILIAHQIDLWAEMYESNEFPKEYQKTLIDAAEIIRKLKTYL